MIDVRISDDFDVITPILKHPEVWPFISDDGSSIDDYTPVLHESIGYYLVTVDDVPAGCFMVVAQNATTVELHTAILPKYRGVMVSKMFALLKEQLAPYSWLRTWVPDYNKPAYRAAVRNGFELVGTEKKAYLKDGQLYDLHLLGQSLCH